MSSNHEDVTAREIDEAQLTAYALGQLSAEERAAAEAILARVEAARQSVQETAALAAHVRQAYQQTPAPEASASLREAIQKELSSTADCRVGQAAAQSHQYRRPVPRLIGGTALRLSHPTYIPHDRDQSRAAGRRSAATRQPKLAPPALGGGRRDGCLPFRAGRSIPACRNSDAESRT